MHTSGQFCLFVFKRRISSASEDMESTRDKWKEQDTSIQITSTV